MGLIKVSIKEGIIEDNIHEKLGFVFDETKYEFVYDKKENKTKAVRKGTDGDMDFNKKGTLS